MWKFVTLMIFVILAIIAVSASPRRSFDFSSEEFGGGSSEEIYYRGRGGRGYGVGGYGQPYGGGFPGYYGGGFFGKK